MKILLYWSLVAVLAGGLFAVSVLYYNVEERWQPEKYLVSRDHEWALSGDQHLFDVTERSFNMAWLDGFKEGVFKWPPLGGGLTPMTPHFVTKDTNSIIHQDEFVLGVLNGSTATAYPLRVMAAHQVVNDSQQDPPVLAYLGPVNQVAAAYSAVLDGKPAVFGTTGLLNGGASLIFDKPTESLFLPLTGRFAAGERLGESLTLLPSAVMTLADWLTLYPASRIMTTNVGLQAKEYPFYDFASAPVTFDTVRDLPVRKAGADAMANVIVLRKGWKSLVVPLPSRVEWEQHEGFFDVDFAQDVYTVHLTNTFGSAYVTDSTGALAPSLRALEGACAGVLGDLPERARMEKE